MKHSHLTVPDTHTVLFATAESAGYAYLADATDCPVVTSARELSALEAEHLVVVPASTNRDLTATTQAAQALKWLKARCPHRTVILSEPLSGDTYAIARMRHHIRALAGAADAVLFVAATINPFADAELLRRVRLAQQYSESVAVEVAFDDVAGAPSLPWPTPESALDKLAALGFDNVRQVRADLYGGPDCAQEPLFKSTSLRAAVLASAERARHLAAHGEDGIAAGLLADHGAGFAHSHGEEHSHSHTHSHAHSHHHHH